MTKKHYPKPRISHIEVGSLIESMALGDCIESDWQRFVSSPIEHPELEAIRLRCISLPSLFPPESSDHYCGEAGRHIMFRITSGLYRHPGSRRKGHWERLIYGDAPATADTTSL